MKLRYKLFIIGFLIGLVSYLGFFFYNPLVYTALLNPLSSAITIIISLYGNLDDTPMFVLNIILSGASFYGLGLIIEKRKSISLTLWLILGFLTLSIIGFAFWYTYIIATSLS